MSKTRLEAFSDAVIAIIMTIMVLEMKAPHANTFEALRPLIPVFLSYVLSFVYLGIYWNNHHHMVQAVQRVNGGILWANMHLLFWLSLVPFATAWMGETEFACPPVFAYGLVLLMAGIAYYILSRCLIRHHGLDSHLARAVGADLKGRISILFYVAAIGLSFLSSAVSCAIYALVALMWLVPDRRIERAIALKEE